MSLPKILTACLIAILMLTGCSDDDDSSSGRDFIEFKLDDRSIRITDHGTGQGTSSAVLQNLDDLNSYSLITSYFRVSGSDNFGVHFTMTSREPLTTGEFTVDGSTSEGLFTFPTFSFAEIGSNTFGARSQNTTGIISISSINPVVNGVVEGSFSFDNIVQLDDGFNVLSEGHRITEGRFRVTIDQIE